MGIYFRPFLSSQVLYFSFSYRWYMCPLLRKELFLSVDHHDISKHVCLTSDTGLENSYLRIQFRCRFGKMLRSENWKGTYRSWAKVKN